MDAEDVGQCLKCGRSYVSDAHAPYCKLACMPKQPYDRLKMLIKAEELVVAGEVDAYTVLAALKNHAPPRSEVSMSIYARLLPRAGDYLRGPHQTMTEHKFNCRANALKDRILKLLNMEHEDDGT